MTNSFFTKHPFFKALIKRVITIGVSWVTVVACLIITFMAFGIFLFSSADTEADSSYTYASGDGYNQLLSIKVNGAITGASDSTGTGLFSDGSTSGYDVKDQLYAAAEDDTIHGVILEVNSPGGTIYGSRAIADGVKYYQQKTGNPVYTYVEGMAASGGYWAASATDKIIADYGSDIGSIGVIMGPFQYYNKVLSEDGGLLYGGVVTQNGIESTYITAGKSKDAGNPYRKLTAEELASLQKAVNNEYDDFVAYVSKERGIPADTIRGTIGALAYDNKTALQYKLIDQIGSRQTAYDELAKEAGIEDDYQIVEEEWIPSFIESLLAATIRKPQPKASANLCDMTRSTLVYHGDVSLLCKSEQ
jgi:protease IV